MSEKEIAKKSFCEKVVSVIINLMVVLDFEVAFKDSSRDEFDPEGAIAAWKWSFGDGITSTEQNPVHVYEKAGAYTIALTVTDNAGATASWEGNIEIIDTGLEEEELPTEFKLAQNYPNPFNPATTINYSLPEASEVTIKVYNIHGQVVSTLVDGTKQAGQHSAQFNASSLASGVYIYQMRAGSFMETQKMVLIK